MWKTILILLIILPAVFSLGKPFWSTTQAPHPRRYHIENQPQIADEPFRFNTIVNENYRKINEQFKSKIIVN
ncbi:unnamed protein product [Caenorhabditis bovis]|uniref:Uncharacterized protein n=1 Tax=Caenorhabditis bovis TaxID=2654633 RepID=A0A8S1F2U4_9PELO|nr:unnamed protein product [Caenorhabditis bovis]